ncbi:hypothetical protein B0H15DRAFT_926608 [Mycena belliarum]|uniref:Uncharacterized protein n=1 Tax=Mycena belliarum TaxID=1033014 RepID=A0AAD6UHA0_9AGAR|nr:hypothetical protein B0H15DRAFT_926608 [Mycena belliae]
MARNRREPGQSGGFCLLRSLRHGKQWDPGSPVRDCNVSIITSDKDKGDHADVTCKALWLQCVHVALDSARLLPASQIAHNLEWRRRRQRAWTDVTDCGGGDERAKDSAAWSARVPDLMACSRGDEPRRVFVSRSLNLQDTSARYIGALLPTTGAGLRNTAGRGVMYGCRKVSRSRTPPGTCACETRRTASKIIAWECAPSVGTCVHGRQRNREARSMPRRNTGRAQARPSPQTRGSGGGEGSEWLGRREALSDTIIGSSPRCRIAKAAIEPRGGGGGAYARHPAPSLARKSAPQPPAHRSRGARSGVPSVAVGSRSIVLATIEQPASPGCCGAPGHHRAEGRGRQLFQFPAATLTLLPCAVMPAPPARRRTGQAEWPERHLAARKRVSQKLTSGAPVRDEPLPKGHDAHRKDRTEREAHDARHEELEGGRFAETGCRPSGSDAGAPAMQDHTTSAQWSGVLEVCQPSV